MSEHMLPQEQGSKAQLSDQYEDQYERLNKAVKQQMQVLFQFNNLLNNEYLIRKFQVDPFNPSQLVLPYEVVQRENSIKEQYVQNEQNTRKQYHLILTKILNTHNGKLWNYDGQYLLIRPYFPKERKRLYIKVHNDSKQAVLDRVAVELQNQQHSLAQVPYQADPSFLKLYITTVDEKSAREVFQKLRNDENINSIMMEDIDYLQEFQTQLQEKKMKRYFEIKQQKQDQYSQQGDGQDQSDQRYHQRGYDQKPRYNKPYRNKQYTQYGNQQQSYQDTYTQRNPQQHPQHSQATPQQQLLSPQQQQGEPVTYQLVRKNSTTGKTPKQTFKTPKSFPKDYPHLDELKNQAVV